MFFNRLLLPLFCAITALLPLTAAHAADAIAMVTVPVNAQTTVISPVTDLPSSTDTQADSAEPALIITPELGLPENDLWQRIRNGYAMPEMDDPLIARHELWYGSRPEYMARMTERAQRYLYYIVSEVERRGMPTEIALLPMIESAFNPGAYSLSHASGIWQFIPSTGKRYGMPQNWWYDGRRDIISATNGALDYLQKLHDQFGDWELALAAYNWGEGSVQRAQERNRRLGLPEDYSSLKMPDETRNYLPKLLAIKNIVAKPANFGLTLQSIPDRPYFTAVSTARHIDVTLAAKLADIPLEEFIALNPAHNRPVILQEDADVLLLPVDKAATFRTNLENYSDPLVSWQAYQSKKGERLDRVAPRFGLSLAKLKSVNGLSANSKLSTGQALLVPLNGEEADEEFDAFNTHLLPVTAQLKRNLSYTVRKGETLSSIARRQKVSVATLKKWNGGISRIQAGQKLNIIQATGKPSRVAKSGKSQVKLAKSKSRKGSVKLARAKSGKKSVKLVSSKSSKKSVKLASAKGSKKKQVVSKAPRRERVASTR